MLPLPRSRQQLSLGCAAAFASADTLDNTSVAIILKTYMETKQKTVSPTVTCCDCHPILVFAHQFGCFPCVRCCYSAPEQDANYQLNPMLKLAEEYAKRFRITHNREVAEQITR
jgi:hypothetical protein